MKSNLSIKIGEELWKRPKFQINKNTKYNNKSLTTNTSGTILSTPQITIDSNSINDNQSNNIKPKLKKSISKLSSLNIFTSPNIIKDIDKYHTNLFLPQLNAPKKTIEILKQADNIVKTRYGKFTIRTLKQTKSNLLQISNKINLNNFLITQIRDKRNEINDLQNEISSKLKEAEYQFLSDKRDFLIFEENLNKKLKNLQEQFNKEQMQTIKTENKYFETEIITRDLESKIENMAKQIMLLQKYARFIHKVFNSPFFLEEINQLDLKEKKYINIYSQILFLFEKNKKILEENNDVLNELEEFMKKFKYFERKIINNFQIKEKLQDEINNNRILYNKLLEQIYLRKEDFEKEYNSLNDAVSKTKEEINYFNNIKQNSLNNIDLCRDLIIDLSKFFELEKDITIKEIPISDLITLCKKIMLIIKGKENIASEYMNNINNIIKSEEKDIIENIINKRKQLNKKMKFIKYLDDQNIESQKRKFKDNKFERRIVIRGRKVFRDIPIFKIKKEELKVNINNDNEAYEFFNYSSNKEK